MKVADLMRTNVLTVSPKTSLKKVNEALHHFNLPKNIDLYASNS